MDEKRKLEIAYEFIKAKEWELARPILESLPKSAKAKEWLAKFPPSQPKEVIREYAPLPKTEDPNRTANHMIAIFILLVIGGLAYYQFIYVADQQMDKWIECRGDVIDAYEATRTQEEIDVLIDERCQKYK